MTVMIAYQHTKFVLLALKQIGKQFIRMQLGSLPIAVAFVRREMIITHTTID